MGIRMQCYYLFLCAQIILESFPISSSGHIAVLELLVRNYAVCIEYFQRNALNFGARAEIVDVLDHFTYGATIIILACFFFSQWTFLLFNIRRCWPIVLKIITYGFIADVITSLFYLGLKWFGIPAYFPLGIGLIITAATLLSLYWVPIGQHKSLTWCRAMLLGTVQGLAVLPGISRLASTYACARWMGICPRRSFEISWLFVLPLISAAFLNSLRVVISSPEWHSLFSVSSLGVMAVAGIISYYALCFVAKLADENRWWWFGVYMALPVAIWWLYI